jgi:hypothetical protein
MQRKFRRGVLDCEEDWLGISVADRAGSWLPTEISGAPPDARVAPAGNGILSFALFKSLQPDELKFAIVLSTS